MSSKDKERVAEEMWQKEKMFDELLALILQGLYLLCKSIDQIRILCMAVLYLVPDVCNELTLESIYVTTVKLICPSHLPLDTK